LAVIATHIGAGFGLNAQVAQGLAQDFHISNLGAQGAEVRHEGFLLWMEIA
jgi:hypothetical protein